VTHKKLYKFRFPGRPEHKIEELPPPRSVRLSLLHPCGEILVPEVEVGATVKTGSVVAGNDPARDCLLVSPITGQVTAIAETKGTRRKPKPGHIIISAADTEELDLIPGATDDPTALPLEQARKMLIRAGIWPLITSLPRHGNVPPLDIEPNAVVVKAVKAEPFLPRGNLILEGRVDEFNSALVMLQRVAGGYARIHLVITAAQSELAQEIKHKTAGQAWLALHYVPVRYPVENDGYLFNHLLVPRQEQTDFHAWFLDVETVFHIGRCLSAGRPLLDRVLALGGNGYLRPTHVRARIGTGIHEIVKDRLVDGEVRLIRGGILTGTAVQDDAEAVGPADHAVTAVRECRERRFLAFVRPGADADSYSRTFLSALFPGRTKSLHTNLRGEPRLCVCCGYCEDVCPADLMPHLLDRCVTHDLIEEAEAAGLELCIECGLCSYVCPSKIEILAHLLKAKADLAREKATLKE